MLQAHELCLGTLIYERSFDLTQGNQGLALIDRIVFTQGMSLKLLVKQNSAQVGMARKTNSVHVPHLTFQPVRRFPQGRQRINYGICFRYWNLDAQPELGRQRIEMVHDLEAGLFSSQVVDSGD